jgi:DNA-binding LytR/AlgR family response regulator
MEKVKILVVEDEILIADNLCDTLEELGYEPMEPALNYTEALLQIKEELPNIAILDIQLGGAKTGIDLAQHINDNFDFPFIFLTSNSDKQTIDNAKEVNPSSFLVKPFTKEELYSTIEIVLSNFSKNTSNENDFMFVKKKGAFMKVPFKEIIYIKSEHVYLDFILKDKKNQIVRGSLNEIIEKLPLNFIRIHRSYIINLDFIQKIETSGVITNNKILPISQKYKQELMKRMNFLK